MLVLLLCVEFVKKLYSSQTKTSTVEHLSTERTRPQAGMLVQIDGSTHHWLEERAKPFSLLAAIDDATGKIVAAIFRQQEDTEGYFMITKQMIKEKGSQWKYIPTDI